MTNYQKLHLKNQKVQKFVQKSVTETVTDDVTEKAADKDPKQWQSVAEEIKETDFISSSDSSCEIIGNQNAAELIDLC